MKEVRGGLGVSGGVTGEKGLLPVGCGCWNAW